MIKFILLKDKAKIELINKKLFLFMFNTFFTWMFVCLLFNFFISKQITNVKTRFAFIMSVSLILIYVITDGMCSLWEFVNSLIFCCWAQNLPNTFRTQNSLFSSSEHFHFFFSPKFKFKWIEPVIFSHCFFLEMIRPNVFYFKPLKNECWIKRYSVSQNELNKWKIKIQVKVKNML